MFSPEQRVEPFVPDTEIQILEISILIWIYRDRIKEELIEKRYRNGKKSSTWVGINDKHRRKYRIVVYGYDLIEINFSR